MKYYIIAGERSGDLHGGNLIKSLKQYDKEAIVKGFGGNYMADAGAQISVHYRDLAFMGFWEVVKNLSTIKKYLKQCKQEIEQFKPDAVILIDYAGFNLKIAKYAKQKGIPVYYYISPKVWAWNQKRALKIKKLVTRMYVIMPFEKEFYEGYQWEVDYVGNPVLDAVNDHTPNAGNIAIDGDYIAILPGSRKQELLNVLPLFDELVKKFPASKFAIATVDNLPDELYAEIKANSNVTLINGYTYDLLAHAKAAIVTSGTATLETAMWEVPQIVMYRTSGISYRIAKKLIRVPYISLVNLIAGKEVVKELIQNDFNLENITTELDRILNNNEYRSAMLEEYRKIKNLLDIGRASDNAAKLMVAHLSKSNSFL
ncbi:Lipid-A-disaccharide synthase [Fulvivirga imtechensis AK7]|uniref:Lipid-A-disaccharide synthase n=1 Tax=Fulvivirga imtechensis AK7 TaxID=1237149 RepID=L8JIC1_9BACT|nr:lipid-A-disaccharide synthase [Fulvivirga imtechensis]ELR68621.1 Lipid-A-disaccharide synthase [Fulvivirga imtechensis AK7]